MEARSGHQERRSQRGGDVIQLDVNRFEAGLGGLGEAKAELERPPRREHGARTVMRLVWRAWLGLFW